MTQGFLATNDANQVLISSDIIGYHHGGQATMISYSSTNGYLAKDLATWPQGGSSPYVQDNYSELSGRCLYTYYWACPTGVLTFPIWFIKPSNYALFHATIEHSHAVLSSGYGWTITVMHSGTTSYPPELHAFVEPRALNSPTSDYGLQTILSDGTLAFDSRLNPLSIQGGGTAKPPDDPTDGSGFPVVDAGYPGSNEASWGGPTAHSWIQLDHDFKCDTTYNSYTHSLPNAKENYMFCAPSLAQACYSRRKYGFYHDSGDLYSGSQDHKSTDVWWGLYRSAFKLTDTTFDAGWCIYGADHTYAMWVESSMFQGDGESYWGGSPPFETQTVNNLGDNAFLITDRNLYP
jgi:hypothetical protein